MTAQQKETLVTTLIPERLELLDALTLLIGDHPRPSGEEPKGCAMELVSWLADEPWSDHPDCVSPVLGAFVRRFNDAVDDDGRERLKPYLPRLIGTADDGQDEARGWLADASRDVAVRRYEEAAGTPLVQSGLDWLERMIDPLGWASSTGRTR